MKAVRQLTGLTQTGPVDRPIKAGLYTPSPTQLNCRRRSAMQLTQLNIVQPISTKQVSRVFVFAFLHGRWRLWSICHINRHVFSVILFITFPQILHSKIPSVDKLVETRHIWRHDLQTQSTGSLRSSIGVSCSRCERVDNSTSSWVAINGPLDRRAVGHDPNNQQRAALVL